ncbi:MAG: sugar phosphate isomerase/epimerase [Thermoplasmata archaeon]|jgi:sugar phosphate isomerase/epimerase|nr:sugar phosphate isomerase/epimerase [Thermoplasmata archaeon]
MIGIGSPTFCITPFASTLESISKHFRLWEILSEGEDRLEVVKDEIRYGKTSFNMKFQVHAPLSDVNIGSVHEPMRRAALDEIKQTIQICRQLDIDMVTVHPGFVQGIAFLNRARALETTKASVMSLAAVAREHSVRIALENMPANINATCTSASELLEAIGDSGIGICFDMGHANTAGQLDQMLALVDRFANVHLHNNEGQWDQHNKVDDGSADLAKVVSVLKRSYKGNIIVEATDLESGTDSKRTLERLLR